jgi:hypothetical protein
MRNIEVATLFKVYDKDLSGMIGKKEFDRMLKAKNTFVYTSTSSRIYRFAGQIFKGSSVHVLAFDSLNEAVVTDYWNLLSHHFLR